MNHQPVTSSFIESIGYNAAEQQLEVIFLSGRKATHEGISPEAHRALMTAESVGKHYNAKIKSSGKAPFIVERSMKIG